MCKGSDVFSLTVLIDRGLDLQIRTDVNEHILTGSGVMPATCSWFFPSHFSMNLYSVLRVPEQENISIVGADDGEGTPVPIPNTAVKLTRADNTWLEAAR